MSNSRCWCGNQTCGLHLGGEVTKACPVCTYLRVGHCSVCDATGRVPDVEATLRAEVARLTEERDSSNRTAESRREAIVALMVDIATAKSRELAEYTSRNAAQLDVKRLATEVERLTADNRVMQLERIIHPPGGEHPDVRNAREQTRLARDWLAQEKAHSERLQDSVYELRSKVTKLELREPTQAEGDAAEGKPDETGRVWAVGSCWLGRTGRRCLDCKRWTWGGPTRCERCAERTEVAHLTATLAERDGEIARLEGREEFARPFVERLAVNSDGDDVCPTCGSRDPRFADGTEHVCPPPCPRAAWLAGRKS